MHTNLPTVQLPGYDRKAPRRGTCALNSAIDRRQPERAWMSQQFVACFDVDAAHVLDVGSVPLCIRSGSDG